MIRSLTILLFGFSLSAAAAEADAIQLRFRQQPSAFNFVNQPFGQAPVLELVRNDGSVQPMGSGCTVRLDLEADGSARLRGDRTRRSQGEVLDYTGADLRVIGVTEDASLRLLARGIGFGACRGLSVYSDYFVVAAGEL